MNRTCSKCGAAKPLTPDHWPPHGAGLAKTCRVCKMNRERLYRRISCTDGLWDNEPTAAEIAKHEGSAELRIAAAMERVLDNAREHRPVWREGQRA